MLPLQVAINARNALAAIDLAKAGFDGPHAFLSGPFGFFALMEDDGNAAAAFAQLGQVWQICRVSHKPFPTGRAAHGGLDGVHTLQTSYGFSVADIAAITVAAPPLVRRLVDRPAHADMGHNYAKLCLGYVIACLLLDGEVHLDAYLPERMQRSAHLALAQRVSMTANDCSDPNALAPQTVTVALRDGRRFAMDLPAVLGHPERPLSMEQHLAKFAACCAAATPPLPGDQQRALIEACAGLSELDDVRRLVDWTIA
jgi:aconitate decarboxylase